MKVETCEIVEGGNYYKKLIECDWCGYSTRGTIREDTVTCCSCNRVLLDLGKPRVHSRY
jgi:DNA-binding helix-hairpin-helix protein with protein kinase domain